MSSRTQPNNLAMSKHNAAAPPGAPPGKVWKSVKNPSNAIEVWADGAVWDTVLNAFILPEDTNVKAPL